MTKNLQPTINDFRTIIIDFDSTLIQTESLEELAAIALADSENKFARIDEIAEYTNAAMEGRMSFTEALQRRIPLLNAYKRDIASLVEVLNAKITPSVERNRAWFAANRDRVYVVSGGFREFIVPVLVPLGFKDEYIYANEFVFDADEKIIGADTTNPLAYENGKTTLVNTLTLPRPICIIGDGYSDYQLKESGAADYFFALEENIHRPQVTAVADCVVLSFDEILG